MMNHDYSQCYKNVFLRPLVHDDIEFLRKWRNDSSNSKYLSQIPFITEEMQERWFERYIADKDELCFAIVEKELGRIVGSLSLYNFNGKSCELGKVLVGDLEAHGKSVGTNAVIAAVLCAFADIDIEHIYLWVYEDNAAAVKTYERAGFERCGQRFSSDGSRELQFEVFRKRM